MEPHKVVGIVPVTTFFGYLNNIESDHLVWERFKNTATNNSTSTYTWLGSFVHQDHCQLLASTNTTSTTYFYSDQQKLRDRGTGGHR